MRGPLQLLLLVVLLGLPSVAFARPLSSADIGRCVRATIKIGALDANGEPVSIGSGAMIDARGYALTNFHVVGNTITGELLHPDGEVLIATVSSDTEAANYHWSGKVVRADPHLDLALVRITGTRTGEPLGRQRFEYIDIGAIDEIHVGEQVWTFGYPSGVRSVNTTAGIVAGFELNLAGEVSWIRTDANINPGNSGGMMVDGSGELVGIPTQVRPADGVQVLSPINLARSVNRIPSAWVEELRAGAPSEYVRHGHFAVQPDQPFTDQIRGDNITLGSPELRRYVLEPTRAGVITVDPPLSIALLNEQEWQVVREGTGQVAVASFDPSRVLLSVLVPPETEQPVDFSVRFDVEDGALDSGTFPIPPFRADQSLYFSPTSISDRLTTTQTATALSQSPYLFRVLIYDTLVLAAGPNPPSNLASVAAEEIATAWRSSAPERTILMVYGIAEQDLWVKFDSNWGSLPSDRLSQALQAAAASAQDMDTLFALAVRNLGEVLNQVAAEQTQTSSTDTSGAGGLQVHVVDAISHQGLPSFVLIGAPGSPLQATLEAVRVGEASIQALQSILVQQHQTGGKPVRLSGLTPGVTYPVAFFNQAYRPRYTTISPTKEAPVVDLGVVELVR